MRSQDAERKYIEVISIFDTEVLFYLRNSPLHKWYWKLGNQAGSDSNGSKKLTRPVDSVVELRDQKLEGAGLVNNLGFHLGALLGFILSKSNQK